jgi:hypothetical protein
MATTTAQIIETPDEPLPFKVVFSKDGQILAERPVTSQLSARELIDALLPLLRKHDEKSSRRWTQLPRPRSGHAIGCSGRRADISCEPANRRLTARADRAPGIVLLSVMQLEERLASSSQKRT